MLLDACVAKGEKIWDIGGTSEFALPLEADGSGQQNPGLKEYPDGLIGWRQAGPVFPG